MKLTNVKISNFKGIRTATIDITNLMCIVGENNAGKSSILRAINLAISGDKITKSEFYDQNSDIVIAFTLSDIDANDMQKVGEAHREKISDILINNSITFVRVYTPSLEIKLLYSKLVPIDQRYDDNRPFVIISENSATSARDELQSLFPEHRDRFAGITTKTALKEKLQEIIDGIDISQKRHIPSDLPSGISNSVKPLLPETIYIEAVKDVNDEVKTKESATFGKIVSLLMKSIQADTCIREIVASFERLKNLLNKHESDDGTIHDDRIQQVKDVESSLREYLRESFPNVDLELSIPPPELKNVFGTAGIKLNDGVLDKIETKGDGIKRSVLFALLRCYVDSTRSNTNADSTQDKYIFLFEEPELYLHPTAQKILFDTLSSISKKHQVIVTTHSPAFFSPDSLGTFIKISKKFDNGYPPFADLKVIDFIGQARKKDIFRMLCYENNSAAFFSKKILFVEGDSDLIFFRHTSKLFNANWNFDLNNISIIRMNGKGNIKKMKEFFSFFDIDLFSIFDNDVLLEGFEQLEVKAEIIAARESFLLAIDRLSEDEAIIGDPSRERIKERIRRMTWVEQYKKLKEICDKIYTGGNITFEDRQIIDYLFEAEKYEKRKKTLRLHQDIPEYELLLKLLREENVFVLKKGCVEDYYPEGTSGNDKPSKAFNACSRLSAREDIICCAPIIVTNGDHEKSELEYIFEKIFASN